MNYMINIYLSSMYIVLDGAKATHKFVVGERGNAKENCAVRFAERDVILNRS